VAGGLQAPVRNGRAVSLGRAAAATSVRNPTAIPGRAEAMPHGESRGSLPCMEAKTPFRKASRFSHNPLQTKLKERLENPVVPPDRLTGFKNHYKIKLRSAGYRLVYEVDEGEVSVIVITVGKRERSVAYRRAKKRSE